LLREENEGFAKVIVELNQPNITINNIEAVQKNIEALIGYFSLDPNRVLDIILDSFEKNVSNDVYIELLKDKKIKRSTISQVLGFKFLNYNDLMEKRDKTLTIS
jgi:THO complex subunit 2